jgi:hypothetical protein
VVDEQPAERQADGAADPGVAPSRAIPVGTRSGGNSSRTMPNESGNTPPPTPCSARPAIIRPRPSLSAHTTEPTAKSASEIARKRSLPNMSPSRPRIGRRDRRGQEVRGEHPGDAVRADAERLLQVHQRGDDRGLRERERQRADAEDRQGDVVVLASPGGVIRGSLAINVGIPPVGLSSLA